MGTQLVMKSSRWLLTVALALVTQGLGAQVVEEYLERHFKTFPTLATAAGRHDLDHRLENLGPEQRQDWLRFNREVVSRVVGELADPELDFEDRLDRDLLLQEAKRQIFDFKALNVPGRNPLFWTEILGNATVFLLVRDDLPLAERLESAASRAGLIPRLTSQAKAALAQTDPAQIAPELCAMAARQAHATATFYAEGFPLAADSGRAKLQERLRVQGAAAARALTDFSEFLFELQKKATGSVRLGELYGENFRLVTGMEEPVERVLEDAKKALAAKVEEAAAYGRSIWPQVRSDIQVPVADIEVIESLFERVSEDRSGTTEEFVEDYRNLAEKSVDFVRQQDVISLPEPLTLHLGRSPSFFIGQSVGGVYPAGPYAPADAKTLLLLPTPSDKATAEQRDGFFRDFNHHFNVMITPHELVPGHYLQLKFAAQHPRKIRALFGDGVYIEGWGTFCERLMLDQGWGGPLDRMAHLKKQMENIARTIVDIRVHTMEMSRDEVLAYVQTEALQDEQFATNMWRRAITSSPQLTSYYLGYREVWGLYEDVRAAQGDSFRLQSFMDGMMEMGPVAVRHYRQRMLGDQGSR